MPPDNDQDPSPVSAPASSEASAPSSAGKSSNPSVTTVASVSGSASNPTVINETDGFIGSTVDGRYFIEKELGQGGVGIIYLARDRKLLDKPVVVKVLLDKSLRDEWVVQKFQQEREALARVDHPEVVAIIDTGELPDSMPYIVMQYVDDHAAKNSSAANR